MPGKAKKFPCPNPLFLEWLEEWKTEAEERGNNSKWTYIKAMNSLKKYPLPLHSGQEARILENIGETIAKKLDKRIEEHLRDGGSREDLHRVEIEVEPAPKRRRKKAKDPEDEFAQVPNSPNMKSPGRAYIPRFRSGPYALLITLYQESKKPTYVGFLTKIELQNLAQPLCDASFTVPDPGSQYTAWSSMGNLLKKGLVLKWSNPAKFNITSTGAELAERLLTGTDEMFQPEGSHEGLGNTSMFSPPPPPPTGSGRKKTTKAKNQPRERLPEPGEALLENLHNILNDLKGSKKSATTSSSTNTKPHKSNNSSQSTSAASKSPSATIRASGNHFVRLQESLDQRSKQKHQDDTTTATGFSSNFQSNSSSYTSAYTPSVAEKRFQYWYVTDKGNTSSLKSEALVTIDETLQGIGFLIKCKKLDLDKANVTYKIDSTRTQSRGYIFVYIGDLDAKEIADTPSDESYAPKGSINSKLKAASNNPSIPPTKSTSTVTRPPPNQNVKTSSTTSKPPLKPATHIVDDNTRPSASSTNLPAFGSEKPGTSTISSTSSGINDAYATVIRKKDIRPLFTLYPGMFDVVLLVDNAETVGGGRRKKEMAENLLKIGVKMEVRKLQLGDFLWIAKEKCGKQRELVLDFILERKRMDDLASSIVDGRFKEQKFRLKSCGLKKLIYLVEKYGSSEHFVVPETTLKQAVMNTQVVDGLFIKETTSIQDSVQYLRLMTNQLTRMYKDKIIHGVSMEDVKTIKSNHPFSDVIALEEQHLIQFNEFSSQTDKNKVLTCREMFVKQLMQMKGVSAERAVAIVNLYPTPSCLMDALDQLPTNEQKMNIVTDLPFGKARKKIGLPISRQLYAHYTMVDVPRD
ncbi:crossover junction endonuclease MUS81-like isoform X2 [Clytia hemisphaerica]|uniref:crossover junction endonuclease MUS81-like isoform X2 n=1 Tax=Clytia hemisphaerica TaxID=252671 RepID=UPI0034D3B5A3